MTHSFPVNCRGMLSGSTFDLDTIQMGVKVIENYIADGLPKQDDDILHDTQAQINALFAVREQRRQHPID